MAPMLRDTGERLLPDEHRKTLIHAEHLARYRLAASLVQDGRVLDAACGEGYGTALLSDAGARRAVGIDNAGDAVSHARAKYGLDYRHADVTALPFADGSFDLVVSFETIEHVADPPSALAEFRRVLTEDGLLIISTPNSRAYRVGNPYHLCEYTTAEFVDLLASYFPEVRPMYQQSWVMSSVLDDEQLRLDDGERALDVEVTKVAGQNPGEEVYTVAICGNDAVGIPVQVGVATGVLELYGFLALVEELERRAAAAESKAAAAESKAREAKDEMKEERRNRRRVTRKLERLRQAGR